MKLLKSFCVLVAMLAATSVLACNSDSYCFKYVSADGSPLEAAGTMQFYKVNFAKETTTFVGAASFADAGITVPKAMIETFHQGDVHANNVKIVPAQFNGINALNASTCRPDAYIGKTDLGTTITYRVLINGNSVICTPVR